jgi:hypothetical protein
VVAKKDANHFLAQANTIHEQCHQHEPDWQIDQTRLMTYDTVLANANNAYAANNDYKTVVSTRLHHTLFFDRDDEGNRTVIDGLFWMKTKTWSKTTRGEEHLIRRWNSSTCMYLTGIYPRLYRGKSA